MNFSPLTAAINYLLAQESWAQRKLALHAGKVACIDAGAIAFTWQITDDGLLQAVEASPAGTHVTNVPNVTIRMKLSDLPMMAQHPERAFSYVNIQGDADFASAISQVGQGVRWDAEHDLSKWVGDILAVRLVSAVKSTVHTVQTTHKKFAENVAEYFLEEQPLLVRPYIVTEFTQQVTTLRDDVERLIKRMERLERAQVSR